MRKPKLSCISLALDQGATFRCVRYISKYGEGVGWYYGRNDCIGPFKNLEAIARNYCRTYGLLRKSHTGNTITKP